MNKLTRSNLQDFCRTCLRSLRTMRPTLVNTTTVTTLSTPSLLGYDLDQWPQLLELVLMLTSLEGVREHMAFPRTLCQLCYDKLLEIQEFQKLAVHSTTVLSDVFANKLNAEHCEITTTPCIKREKCGNSENDEHELLLPELSTLWDTPIKTELIDIEDSQPQSMAYEDEQDDDNADDDVEIRQVKVEMVADEENTNSNSNFDEATILNGNYDSLGDDADDADDEEHALRNGAANSSSAGLLSISDNSSAAQRKRDRSKKSLQCPRCEKHVYKQVYLDAHIRAVHEGHEKPFLCAECTKAFTRYNQLREHIQSIHELKKKLICTFNGCNTSFKTKTSLQTHFKVIHAVDSANNPYALGLQQMLELHTTTQMSTVSEVSMQNICLQCSRQYSSKRALSEHLKRHAQIKEHVCKECGVAKVTRTELLTHMRTHEPNPEKFKCSMCPQQFNHKNAISRHVRVVHEGQRRYQCSYCPKRFGTRNSQTCHERLHTGERPFSCKLCVKTFAQVEGLKSHMKNHDKMLRKHVCSYCPQRFITRQNLVDHERRHNGDKPHICQICSRGFFTAEDLSTHCKLHIEEQQQQQQQQPQQQQQQYEEGQEEQPHVMRHKAKAYIENCISSSD